MEQQALKAVINLSRPIDHDLRELLEHRVTLQSKELTSRRHQFILVGPVLLSTQLPVI